MSLSLNAQLSIRGTEYTLVGEMETYYTTPRTDAERFPDINWEEVNVGNFTSMVKSFVRDAISHGANLDLSTVENSIIELSHPSRWNYISTNPRNQPAGSAFYPGAPGFRIYLNEYHWSQINDNQWHSAGIRKIQLVYHELGHALLHSGHVCDRYGGWAAVMATGTCRPDYILYERDDQGGFVLDSKGNRIVEYRGPGYTQIRSYNLQSIEGWIDHLFETIVPFSMSQARKGSGPTVIHD